MILPYQINAETFPEVRAGVETLQCECGWERVYILPEESDLRLMQIFRHLMEEHSIRLPIFTVTVL